MLHLFLSIILFSSLSNCDEAAVADPIRREMAILKNMVQKVSLELTALGFKVDPSYINIDIKDAKSMATVFNKISNDSKREIKLHTPFGPQDSGFDDGARSRLAFYDPNSKTIVFLKGASKHLSKGYLAHELTHVYQDQKWGFDNIWRPYQQNPSKELFNITQFIIEGHAELVRQGYEQKQSLETKKLVSESLGKISENDCLVCDKEQSTANLPYFLGLRFLLQQYRNGGWPLVERFFENLPSSTEQIIHPNKHRIDLPTEISLAAWTDDNKPTELVQNGSLGEAFLLTKLLNLGIKRSTAFESASGWDGDIAQLYKTPDGEDALAWRIIFDRPLDAEQLESALKDVTKPGEIIRMGRVMDWIISDSEELKDGLRIFLSTNQTELPANIQDEKTTIEQEIAIKNDADVWSNKDPESGVAISSKH